MESNLEDSILESNDQKRERRLAAYSNMVAIQDSNELSSGLISIEDMEIERISLKRCIGNLKIIYGVWNNSSSLSYDIQKNISISIVNLGMPDSSGKSSTLSIII